MEKRRPMLELMVEAADLPAEMMPGMPLVELCGDRKVLVENHRGVREYSPERISVRLTKGSLIIRGRKLNLEKMQAQTLIVTGTVEGLDFERGVTL